MNSNSRRVFMIKIAAAGGALACGQGALATSKKIEESEPKATALGYRHESSKVDAKRFPKHSASEKCSGCMAWVGKPSDAWAECDLMADRMVASAGWCSSYVKAK